MDQNISKKDERELRRENAIFRSKVKKIVWIVIGIAVLGGIIWLVASAPKTPEGDIFSRRGLHWHSTLVIYVNGEKQEVSPNIGVTGGSMMPMHTHEPNGTVHIESSGLVRKDDVVLGRFFKIWGKDINSFGTNLKMTVNGQENTEYENYVMQDKDKIELRYE